MGQGIYHAIVYGAMIDDWLPHAENKQRWAALRGFSDPELQTSYEADREYVGFTVAVCDPGLAHFRRKPLLSGVCALDDLATVIAERQRRTLSEAREKWAAFAAHMSACGVTLPPARLLFVQDYD